jgi:hypothetical protein
MCIVRLSCLGDDTYSLALTIMTSVCCSSLPFRLTPNALSLFIHLATANIRLTACFVALFHNAVTLHAASELKLAAVTKSGLVIEHSRGISNNPSIPNRRNHPEGGGGFLEQRRTPIPALASRDAAILSL